MPIQLASRGKSLNWTPVAGQNPAPPTGPLTNIQSYSFSRSQELAEFLSGTSRVKSHFRGTESATIKVETADIAVFAGFSQGQKLTNVTLRIEGARDSAGASAGDDVLVTLSHAVVSEVGELSSGNENSAPVVGSVTFQLSKFPELTEDPTVTITSGGA